MVRATGGLRDTVFDVDCDKARAAWEMEGSSDWERDGLDATNGFSFEARSSYFRDRNTCMLIMCHEASSVASHALHALQQMWNNQY